MTGTKEPPQGLPFCLGACFLPILWLLFHRRVAWALLLVACSIVFTGLTLGCSIAAGPALTGLVGIGLASGWAVQIVLGLKGSGIAWTERRYATVAALEQGERPWRVAGIVAALALSLPSTILSVVWAIQGYDSPVAAQSGWSHEAAFRFIDALQPVAFLFGPLALGILTAIALRRGERTRLWLAPAAIPLAALSAALIAAANGAFVANAFSGIAVSGRTESVRALATVSLAVFRSLFYGVLAMAVCLAAAAIFDAALKRAEGPSEPGPPWGRWVLGGVAVSALVAGALVWLNDDVANVVLGALDPAREAEMRARFAGGVMAVAETLNREIRALILGGAALAPAALGLAFAAYVLFRRRRPARAAYLAVTALLVLAILGTGWAAVQLHAEMGYVESFLEKSASVR